MKKFYLCKLCLIVFGASLAAMPVKSIAWSYWLDSGSWEDLAKESRSAGWLLAKEAFEMRQLGVLCFNLAKTSSTIHLQASKNLLKFAKEQPSNSVGLGLFDSITNKTEDQITDVFELAYILRGDTDSEKTMSVVQSRCLEGAKRYFEKLYR